MIEDIKRTYKSEAGRLGDYQKLSVDELANGYCDATDAGNEVMQSRYFSALFLRFWYKIEKMYYACQTIPSIERDDCASQLAECINVACTYRGWRDPAKKLNAQQCINQVISTRGAPAIIYEYNRDKLSANVNTLSIDTPINDDDDSEITILDTMASDTSDAEAIEADDVAAKFVQSYINKNKIVEAIILDTIAFKDTVRTTTNVISSISPEGKKLTHSEVYSEFWPHKCVQELSELPANYADYFSSKYSIKSELLHVALDKVRNSANAKLYKYVRATLADARKAIS